MSLDADARSLGLKSLRTSDGHRVALRPAAVAPAVFYAVASEHGAQPRLMVMICHLGFFITAGHCNERQAGLLGHNSPKLMVYLQSS